jgi:hypothetical protein
MVRCLCLAVLTALLLVACGTSTQIAQAPTPQPVVITQIVTRIVERTVVVTATPKPATPTPKATATSKPEPTPVPTEAPTEVPTAIPVPMGKWEVSRDASSFDDSTTVVVRLAAEGDITGPYETYRPSIILRCQEHETEAYINVGMQPDVEYDNYDGATIRYRFDKEASKTDIAGKSTDNLALFLDAPQTYINTMLKHEQFVFGFTPFNGNSVEATFDLRGLSEAIKPLREVCPVA